MFRADLLSIVRNLDTSYVYYLLARSGWTSLADSQHNQYDKHQLLRI